MRHLAIVLELTLHVYRCSLARATGPFSSQGSFCLVQREQTGNPSPKGQGWHNQFLDPLFETFEVLALPEPRTPTRSRNLDGRKNCSCGDLDGEASLIVARRAPLVVAFVAVFYFLTA